MLLPTSNVIAQLSLFEKYCNRSRENVFFFLLLFDSLLTFLSVNYFVKANISVEQKKLVTINE